MNLTLIGLDLAKNIIQVCGVNRAGRTIFNRAIKRIELFTFLAKYPEVPIAMEVCSGSNYLGRSFDSWGRKVMLIPPQHVNPATEVLPFPHLRTIFVSQY